MAAGIQTCAGLNAREPGREAPGRARRPSVAGRKEAMHFTGLQSSCHRLSSVREKAAGEISLEVGD